MNELINVVVQRTGLSQEDAQKAVTAVIDFLKTKLPPQIASHIDGLIAGGSASALEAIEGEAGELIKGKLGNLLGGQPS